MPTAVRAVAELPSTGVRAKYLGIFLRDHLATARLAIELARRTHRFNQDGVGEMASRLMPDLEKDRIALLEIARRVGVRPSLAKLAGAWIAEKLGRLKLNGHLLARSPLSALVETESLAMLTTQRRGTWRILERLSRVDGRLEGVDIAARVHAADEARDLLERAIVQAADQAL